MRDFGISNKFNSLNFLKDDTNNLKNKNDAKKEIVQSLINEGVINESEKENILQRIDHPKESSFNKLLDSLESDITNLIESKNVNLSNINATKEFTNNLFKSNDNELFMNLDTKNNDNNNGGLTEVDSLNLDSKSKAKITIIRDNVTEIEPNILKFNVDKKLK